MKALWIVEAFLCSAAMQLAQGKICDGFFANGIEDKESGVNWLSCPQDHEPFYYTQCCANNNTLRCCPNASFIQYFDEEMVMIMSIIVISTCILLIILTLICCFSSRCPLYNFCRVNYTQEGIIAYSAKEAERLTGDSIDETEQKSYQPMNVKMKLMDDV